MYSNATLGAGYIPAFGGNPNTAAENMMKMLAQNVTGIIVPNSGHYIAEEQPDVVVKLLNNFFSGNSTTSNRRDLTHSSAIILSHYIF